SLRGTDRQRVAPPARVLDRRLRPAAGGSVHSGQLCERHGDSTCRSGRRYDLDIVVVCADPGASAADAIADLREKLEEDADLAKRLEPDEEGRPCVRLRYAKEGEGFGFHVDVVPARPCTEDAPLEVPMRGREEWRGTDPLAYTTWCLDGGELFR